MLSSASLNLMLVDLDKGSAKLGNSQFEVENLKNWNIFQNTLRIGKFVCSDVYF